MARLSWLDESNEKSMLDGYVQQLESFTSAFADGRIDEHELERQERALVDLMKQVEPKLSDELHEQVTRLLCEMSVYHIMQSFHNIQQTAARAVFRG